MGRTRPREASGLLRQLSDCGENSWNSDGQEKLRREPELMICSSIDWLPLGFLTSVAIPGSDSEAEPIS